MKNLRMIVSLSALLAFAGGTMAFEPGSGGAGKPAEKAPDKVKREAKKEAPETPAAATLKVGDKAPELKVGKFLKGDAITGFEKGQVYVIEMWATWCGPCITVMPHVSKLQKQYKDQGLTVIGVNIWEDASESKLQQFVDKQGDKMAYTVVMDDTSAGDKRSGAMAKTWMTAAGRNGIPSAFLVNGEGNIAWMGHPGKLDDELAKIFNKSSDTKKDEKKKKDDKKKDDKKKDGEKDAGKPKPAGG